MQSHHTTNESSVKLCECGCGQPAPIATRTNTRIGHIKGKPIRFIRGHAGHPVRPVEERFWKYVQKTDTCWLWTGATTNGGYGVLQSGPRDGKIIRAHRFSYEIHHGPIPDEMDVCHHCDIPSCVNPSHLFIGTVSDNMADCVNKGRHNPHSANRPRGTRHGQAKLTEFEVLSIRAEYATGNISQRALARKYNISRRSIMFIVNREQWTHI